MSCLITSGAGRPCVMSSGGIRKIWLANFSEVTSFITVGVGVSYYDTITMVSGKKFYEFELRAGNGFYKEEEQISGNSIFMKQTVGLKTELLIDGEADLNQAADDMRVLVNNLLLGKFVAIVETQNGIRKILGWKNPLESASAVGQSGVVAADFAGFDIVLGADQPQLAPVLDNTYTIPV